MEFNGKTMTVYGTVSAGSDAHAADKNNPHEVTAKQVGAAPAGYGLGETASRTENWNAAYVNGFARGNSNSPDKKMWYGIVCKDSANNSAATEIAFSVDSGKNITEARRTCNSAGVWGEWEYVNPPMLEGVEYRTTERHNGKAVYAKLVNLGQFGSSGEVKTEHVADGVVCIVDAKLSVRDADENYYFNCNVTWEMFTVDGDCMCSFASNDFSDTATASVLLKYTKE